jgi:squalene synthase HpnC
MAVDKHYENFPVASILVPPHVREHVVAIYRFARHADDVADEGNLEASHRIEVLAELARDIHALFRDEPVKHPTVKALMKLRDAKISGVNPQPFLDLLSAFAQDVSTHRYATYSDLQDYCRRSANPIGRLMLALANVEDSASIRASDSICTALQLINFWQDAAIDASRGRVYVPQEDFTFFGVSDHPFPEAARHRALMQFQCERSRLLLMSGIPLLGKLRGRFRVEIAYTVGGGLRVLEKIANNKFDVCVRPTIRWYDGPRITMLAMRALLQSRQLSS